jgi:hypothetical protein
MNRKTNEVVDFIHLQSLSSTFNRRQGWQSNLHLHMQKVSDVHLDLNTNN